MATLRPTMLLLSFVSLLFLLSTKDATNIKGRRRHHDDKAPRTFWHCTRNRKGEGKRKLRRKGDKEIRSLERETERKPLISLETRQIPVLPIDFLWKEKVRKRRISSLRWTVAFFWLGQYIYHTYYVQLENYRKYFNWAVEFGSFI